MNTRAKQKTELSNIKMPMNPQPAANLKMVHTKLLFASLKTLLNRNSTKRYPKQSFQPNAACGMSAFLWIAGFINDAVEAENKNEAAKKTLVDVGNIPENEFLWALEPQVADIDIELVND